MESTDPKIHNDTLMAALTWMLGGAGEDDDAVYDIGYAIISETPQMMYAANAVIIGLLGGCILQLADDRGISYYEMIVRVYDWMNGNEDALGRPL